MYYYYRNSCCTPYGYTNELPLPPQPDIVRAETPLVLPSNFISGLFEPGETAHIKIENRSDFPVFYNVGIQRGMEMILRPVKKVLQPQLTYRDSILLRRGGGVNIDFYCDVLPENARLCRAEAILSKNPII